VRKPPHSFAIVVWVASLLILAVEPFVDWTLYGDAVRAADPNQSATAQPAIDLFRFWVRSRESFLRALELASAGFVIELLDWIRWQLTPEGERDQVRRRYLPWRILTWLRASPWAEQRGQSAPPAPPDTSA
jgi:hypothetical protein